MLRTVPTSFVLISLIFAGASALLGCEHDGGPDHFAVELTHVGSIGDPADTEFGTIGRLTVDREGILYVTDSTNRQVVAYDAEGNRLHEMGRGGEGPGEFSGEIRGVAVVGDSVYVAEASPSRFHVFDKPLEFSRRIIPPLAGFIPMELVSTNAGLVAGGLGIDKDSRLGILSDDLGSIEPLSLIRSHYDYAWDTLLLDAMPDTVVVAYLFRNVVEIHPLDGGEPSAFTVAAGLSPPEPPPVDETTERSSPEAIPSDFLLWDVAVDTDGHIFLLGRDLAEKPGQDVFIYNSTGDHLHTLTLPEPSQRIRIAENGQLYAVTGEGTSIDIYDLEISSNR